ncbi:MAG: hypothetical protein WAU86_23045 [Oricola sp.]
MPGEYIQESENRRVSSPRVNPPIPIFGNLYRKIRQQHVAADRSISGWPSRLP